MKRGYCLKVAAAGCLAASAWLAAAPPTGAEVFKWIQQGYKLSARDAGQFEDRLKRKPDDPAARVQLLAYYTDEGNQANRQSRLRHIIWLLENDADERAGLAQVRNGLLRLNCSGDPLADAQGFGQALPLWIKLARKSPKGLTDATDAIRYCAPEEAEKLLIEAGDRAGLGRLYAQAALGVTGESYRQQEPAGTDAALRASSFGQRAVRILAEATQAAADKPFLAGAASQLLGQGGILWADGKLDWDYMPLGRPLLHAAIQLNPEDLRLLALPQDLPKRGERPELVIRVGGNVAANNLTHKVTPQYPEAARLNRIEGAVKFTALLGLDGKVVGLHVESGPAELVPSATEAVRQWVYRPTLLNGKSCYIITRIDVNYVLSAAL